jgi:hypothetical protein
MNDDEFENIIREASESFDTFSVALSEGVEMTKKVIDAATEVFGHAVGIGLPDELASDMSLTFYTMLMGMPGE